MEIFEKYGENLFSEFNYKLREFFNIIKQNYGNEIRIEKNRHTQNILMTGSMGNYSLEIVEWKIFKNNEQVTCVSTMMDNFGYYYRIKSAKNL